MDNKDNISTVHSRGLYRATSATSRATRMRRAAAPTRGSVAEAKRAKFRALGRGKARAGEEGCGGPGRRGYTRADCL